MRKDMEADRDVREEFLKELGEKMAALRTAARGRAILKPGATTHFANKIAGDHMLPIAVVWFVLLPIAVARMHACYFPQALATPRTARSSSLPIAKCRCQPIPS